MQRNEIESEPLDRLVSGILQSARYRELCPAVVRRIGAVELARRKTWKEAEKETRNRLHQIGGAYLESRPPYGKWIEALHQITDAEIYREEMKRMMLCHASARERLPILNSFYDRTLSGIRPIRSVIDVACGFNALAVPWMGIEENGRYEGYDLYLDMADFLAAAACPPRFYPQYTVRTEVRDVAVSPPDAGADLALVLKFLPLLDRSGAPQMLDWLQRLSTRYALVSFPTRTLGGRNVGMAGNYEDRFREVLQQAGWNSERFEFANELCFLVEFNQRPVLD